MMRRPPVFVYFIASFMAIAILVVSIALYQWQAEKRNDCERAVQYRQDNRTMWLYLIVTAPDKNSKKVVSFSQKLNELLPPLKCENNELVPDTE